MSMQQARVSTTAIHHRFHDLGAELWVDTALTDDDHDEVRRLWEEFRVWLGGRYPGDHGWLVEAYFDEPAWLGELASLPGVYHRARGGSLLIARFGEQAVGTVAMRALDAGRCEMKRMYVSHAARGRGIGDLLVGSVVHRARELGYDEMVLDTGFRQHEATRLYLKHGFELTGPHYDVDPRLAAGGLTFMRRRLGAA